jgi:hypothetical protein
VYELINFGAIYGVILLLLALVLTAAVVCLIVFLVSASKAMGAIARYRRVQTELLLADAVDPGPPHVDDPDSRGV